ncbi:MAG: lytic transglycosylase domain-containing protein [Mesorhizobium sp.]|uniref:lytic transglycosylase domain-containing protein n=1 Tax=Mesorhizobium sp. TaxID=1871066 RepID=UPI0011FE0925|nr:lytic transglycosylase domain-containing protein [Mesorhizobium sp.]TIW10394.1 MAG: lytic transglycosylase domain-containing protein [Mesorhizobium sp.]
MAAKIILTAIGALVAAAGLSGCTSTSQMKAAPALSAAATPAVEDDTPTVALPETVAVLPEPSGLAPVQMAAFPADANMAAPGMATPGEPLPLPAQPAAFAGSTPLAAQPAVMAGTSPLSPGSVKPMPAYATAAMAMPVTGQAVKAATMPGVQQVAYFEPQPHATGPRAEIERLIEKYSALYEVPIDLVRHVVNRESTFNPKAYNHGHWGLMQIKHATARGMGYDGPASGLFDAETNLKYAVKYLRGAWLVSGGDEKRADRLYQSGYYYDAKRKGLLEATGLGVDRARRRLQPDA